MPHVRRAPASRRVTRRFGERIGDIQLEAMQIGELLDRVQIVSLASEQNGAGNDVALQNAVVTIAQNALMRPPPLLPPPNRPSQCRRRRRLWPHSFARLRARARRWRSRHLNYAQLQKLPPSSSLLDSS